MRSRNSNTRLPRGNEPRNRETAWPRILLGVTSDTSLRLMTGFPEYLSDQGWDVHIVSSPGPLSSTLIQSDALTIHTIPMRRVPSLRSDIRALAQWVLLLREVQPDISSLGTPKAGLIGGVASYLTRTPTRVYMLRGLRFETATGIRRAILRRVERISCAAAHEVVAISPSLKSVALNEGIVREQKIVVVGNGSSNGVALVRFATSSEDRRRAQEDRWGSSTKPVLGYVGRINPDKGVGLLADALKCLARDNVAARLLVVGGADSPESESLRLSLDASGIEVEFVGQVPDVAPFLKLIDVLCLPTKREGFGNVIIEAAAAGIPTVATESTGVTDAIVDGVTGMIVRSRDPERFATAAALLLKNTDLRHELGDAALKRAISNFSQDIVWQNYAAYYRSLLERRSTEAGRSEIPGGAPER